MEIVRIIKNGDILEEEKLSSFEILEMLLTKKKKQVTLLEKEIEEKNKWIERLQDQLKETQDKLNETQDQLIEMLQNELNRRGKNSD